MINYFVLRGVEASGQDFIYSRPLLHVEVFVHEVLRTAGWHGQLDNDCNSMNKTINLQQIQVSLFHTQSANGGFAIHGFEWNLEQLAPVLFDVQRRDSAAVQKGCVVNFS